MGNALTRLCKWQHDNGLGNTAFACAAMLCNIICCADNVLETLNSVAVIQMTGLQEAYA